MNEDRGKTFNILGLPKPAPPREKIRKPAFEPEAVRIPEYVLLVVHGAETAAYVGAGGQLVPVDHGWLKCFAL